MATIKLGISDKVDVRGLSELELSEDISRIIVAILVKAHEIDPTMPPYKPPAAK
jgi:hypothetical protein